jgi:hypothetical protein
MRSIINAIFLFFLVSCSSGSKSKPAEPEPDLNQALDAAACTNADDFRGTGIGSNENEAIVQARSNMAQEYFVEKLKSSVDIGGQNINGVATTNTYTNIRQNAKLMNPSDAKLYYSKRQGERVGVVVCMTKADAAKGFVERQRQVADSLLLVSNTALNTEHPKHKNEAWQKTQMLYNDFVRIQNLLEGWGVKSPYLVDEIYSKTREDYRNYCQGMKIYWQDTQNECSNAIFAAFSKNIKIEKSQCSGGLNLNFNCLERCKSSAYGIECSFEPSLSIESCGGQSYSLLKAQMPITTTDMYNEAKSREKMIENLTSAAFLNEWEKEIKEWIPKCTD